jgi:Co/Zn/Cd efflux system component
MPATISPPSSSSPPLTSVNVLAHIDDNQQRRPSDTITTASTTTPHLSTPTVRKHKSVKSITREYEVQQTTAGVSSPTLLSPPFASSNGLVGKQPPSPRFLDRRGSSESTSNSTSHSRRASVLLASGSFPSTLSDQQIRPRTTSTSSISAKDQSRSPSLKLASAAYPSSYSRSPKSSGGDGPLPIPAMPLPNATSLPMLNVQLDEDKNGDQSASLESEEENDLVAELSASPSPKTAKSQMTAAERRDHSRKHSRVHSRNLSVFFPRPGTEAEKEADDAQAASHFTKPRVNIQTQDLSPTEDDSLQIPSTSSGVSLSPSKSNRGHHRKHSVNHALLSTTRNFADKTSASDAASYGSSKEQYEEEKHVLSNAPAFVEGLSSPVKQTTALSSLPASHRPLLVFGAMHFVVGATLWTKGQSGDSLSLTGLGYLVVFDAFGILNGVISEWLANDWKHQGREKQLIRRPYGPHRVETVLQFSQTIFLLFASIYVCKESVEHALLEGVEEHHEEDDTGLVLPSLFLIFTTAACLFSNMVLQTHDKLVAACGIATTASDSGANKRRSARGHGRANSILVDPSTLAGPFLHLFSNPFSITVLFFCLTLTSAAIVMPPFQVAALDKVLAGLESVAMLYIAYPASKALGKILLQTAPKSFNTQNVQLLRSIKTIEEHPLVTYVAPPHLWQLTPPTSALNSSNGALIGSQRLAKNASLIATVEVFLKEDASDSNVLEMTKWAWTLLAPAVGAGAGLQAGESLRGAIRAGEIAVQVSREGQRDRYRKESHTDCHHHHEHGHEHTHDHHNHGHEQHSHAHNHQQANHSHDHIHSHSPSHTHDHQHSHGHDTHGKHIHSH